jgi:FKBP-type peptidyl-prolyl cis-trans isomerase FkpA/FKBP-type peptidyl-prolyl cis-trans isomerase FklB
MKSVICAVLAVGTAMALTGGAGSVGAAEAGELKTLDDKFSYTLGMNLGKQLRQNDVKINFDIYFQALKDAQGGKELLLTDEEGGQVMREFQTTLRDRQLEKGNTEGKAFLAENKKVQGVTTTASGLQYKIATKGDGPIPTTNDTVVVHYRGTLLDGTEFDNSFKRGEPTTFPVTRVIPGWTEALLMMPVGSKWQLFIPGELAYGAQGNRNIPPNSTLLFDVELLEIQKPDAAPAPPALIK